MIDFLAEWEPELLGEGCGKIRCPDMFQEGQWHHVVLVLNRAVLKNSTFSMYLDGQHVNTIKVNETEVYFLGLDKVGVS